MSKDVLKLNLGSGYQKLASYINIDSRSETWPDLCLDVTASLPYGNNSVDEIRAFDFLEHIPTDKIIEVIEEIYRVLKPGGKFESFTPSTDGRGAFQDPTHKSFWNRNSWFYYSLPAYRKLYGIKAEFEIVICEDKLDNPAEWGIIHTYVVAIAKK